jgi:hypothetical protein
MNTKEFVRYLVGVWLGFILATVSWVLAYRAFIIPAYMRYEREEKVWPEIALWVVDLAIYYPVNYKVWFWCAAIASGVLFLARRPGKRQRTFSAVARTLSIGYISILLIISLGIAAVSTL